MLCSKCYKKIPAGEEVAKLPSFWTPKSKWQEGNEIYCKRCAVRQDRNDKLALIIPFSIFFLFLFITFIYFLFTKQTQKVYAFIAPIVMSFLIVVVLSISLFLSSKSKKKGSRLIRKTNDVKKSDSKNLENRVNDLMGELIKNELELNENFCRKIIKDSKIKSSLIKEKISNISPKKKLVINSKKEKRIEELLEEIEQKRKDLDQEMKSMKKINNKLEDIFADIEKSLGEIKGLKEEIEELKKEDN